jgi:hypothetical protein
VKKPEYEPDAAGPLYWIVESDSDPEAHYLVYLGANDGKGYCNCTWHRAEVQAAYDQRRIPRPRKSGTMPYTCKHVEAAQERFDYWIKYELVKQNPNHNQDSS